MPEAITSDICDDKAGNMIEQIPWRPSTRTIAPSSLRGSSHSQRKSARGCGTRAPREPPRSYGLFQPDHADVRRPDQRILLPTPPRGLPQDAAHTEPGDRHTVLIRSQLTLYTLWATFESLTANQCLSFYKSPVFQDCHFLFGMNNMQF
jgi:hypothetical protein